MIESWIFNIWCFNKTLAVKMRQHIRIQIFSLKCSFTSLHCLQCFPVAMKILRVRNEVGELDRLKENGRGKSYVGSISRMLTALMFNPK